MTKLPRASNPKFPISNARPLVLGIRFFIGAWMLGSGSFAAEPATPAPSAEPTPLARIVTRLSTAKQRTARDWAEFARETVTWGSRLQSAQEQVPEGPIRDALSAVDLGSDLDPKTADWPKLRQELEAFLKKPEEPPPQENQDQQNQDQQKQDQQQQKDQSKQDQSGKEEKSSEEQQQQKQDQQQQSADQQKQDGKDQQNPPEQQQAPQEDQSAFGDMKDQPPPPSPEETQQVGGVPERKDGQPPPTDPNLALPLQKLDQLKSQDSPAELFKLMEGEKDKTPRKPKKDW